MEFKEIDNLGAKPGKLIFEEETYSIVGAAMEVYYKLGSGFLEPVYQEALSIEFSLRGIPFEAQKVLRIDYKGHRLRQTYYVDFLCFDQIIVEIKSLDHLSPHDWSQVINYLKVSNLRLGLLFNFGSVGRLEQKRLIVEDSLYTDGKRETNHGTHGSHGIIATLFRAFRVFRG